MSSRIGLDIGSTTLKMVVADEDGRILYARYRRHRSDVCGEMLALLDELDGEMPGLQAPVCLTGSAGMGLAEQLGLPFVQEVAAAAGAVGRFYPEADVIIELGGEDAKLTYLTPVLSQRMNGVCAGGTGAFIDQMAALLQTDAQGLDALAAKHNTLFTIASRCGVFAKSDMQALLGEGATREDLAASVLQAVVNQTIAGLACGQPIRGTVVLLGGPLHFLSSLRDAFARTLRDCVFLHPEHAEVTVALGAALGAKGPSVTPGGLSRQLRTAGEGTREIPRLPPLFGTQEEKDAFEARHALIKAPRAPIEEADGPCFLGMDAGSTTIKAVLLSQEGRLLFAHYTPNRGSPLRAAIAILREMYAKLPQTAYIGHACVTGYGEALLKTALRADTGEIETLAHMRAAQVFRPEVDFILDIGGQDMKCMRVADGVIESILLNEACSSGCGSFISSFAESLGLTLPEFVAEARGALSPVDLGTRCTVFMNSRVKQAQKEGATVGDISAGLSYSVVRNALYKVIGIKRPEDLGKHPVVQGGTFLNDAILRCFEVLSGREAIRPDISGHMGAYGAAVIARERWQGEPSTLLPSDCLGEGLPEKVNTLSCKGCQNHCMLTMSTFTRGRKLVSGNRCERFNTNTGAGGKARGARQPDFGQNLFAWKYDRLFSYVPLAEDKAPRGVVGLPRTLNLYENYPFWFTMLTELGFSVKLSRHSSHALFEAGMATIPSESVCYPAKLAHGHIQDLADSGVKVIFYPCVPYERRENEQANNHFNCPIVTSYPEVLGGNMDTLRQQGVVFLKPFLSLHHRRSLPKTIARAFARWGVSRAQARRALDAAFAEDERFKQELRAQADGILRRSEEDGQTCIVLAGRPYHLDPEVHHGIPDLLTSLGFAVLTEDAVSDRLHAARPLRVFDQWMYHTRLYDAATYVASKSNLELVQLNSFGCGLDAITTDQVRDILKAAGKTYTLLKIDEITNLGAARIRLRSLQAALRERMRPCVPAPVGSVDPVSRVEFTPEMKKAHTIIAPQMSPVHFKLVEAVLGHAGYRCVILERATREDIEIGLRFVNNDACYPTVVVVGQLLGAMLSGAYDPDNTSIFLTQTGGGCRATNYVSLLRRALADAGFPQVPVVALSVGGLEKNSGLTFTPDHLARAVKALVVGDLLSQALLRTRPYEQTAGAAQALFDAWLGRAEAFFSGEGAFTYRKLISAIVRDFDALPLRDIPRKPRVGLVGEILVKFHPDANNNAVAVIENEGCEAVVPGLLGFIYYCFTNVVIKAKMYGASYGNAAGTSALIKIIKHYENPCRRALQASRRFHPADTIHRLADRARTVLSLGNQCGEGWLLTAEMMELIENGVMGIVCAQPFACLPNHVTGKGMLRELRRRFPHVHIVPVDYDPGASEVNQLNRIKLMIAGITG